MNISDSNSNGSAAPWQAMGKSGGLLGNDSKRALATSFAGLGLLGSALACGGKTNDSFECNECGAPYASDDGSLADGDATSPPVQTPLYEPEVVDPEPAPSSEDDGLDPSYEEPVVVDDPIVDEPSEHEPRADDYEPEAACTSIPTFELAQVIPHSEYGRNDTSFQLSPDGGSLLMFTEQYASPDTLLEMDLTSAAATTVPFRTSSHDWQLALHREDGSFVVSRAGEPLWEQSSAQAPYLEAAFSADDQVLVFAMCPAQTLTIERHDATSGELLSELHTDLACSTSQPASAIVEVEQTTLFRLEALETGLFSLEAEHLVPIRPDTLPELSMAAEIGLSPDGTRLVVGYPESEEDSMAMRLAMISLPDQEVIVRDLPSQMTFAYSGIYANWLMTLPISWAPDGSYFVAPDADGNIAARSSCDGALLTTLPAADPSEGYIGWQGTDSSYSRDTAGPSNLAFDADGDRLVAYFVGRGVHVYELTP